jgi:hypothetical protein
MAMRNEDNTVSTLHIKNINAATQSDGRTEYH